MNHKNKIPSSIFTNPIHFIACGFGSGAMPYAPGTFGTMVAIPLYLIIQPLSLVVYLSVLFVATFIGFWLCGKTARDFGVHDHPAIVWDEILGYGITMIAAPQGWLWIILGFLLFRLFDIWKPWPIHTIDQYVNNGVGIVLDDIIAGVYASISLQIIFFMCDKNLWV